jgi:TusA-related sulfurtransferase
MSTRVLDARGLFCPMPVIRIQEQVPDLAPGTVLDVICTDPGATRDIPAWCKVHGHRVQGICERPGEYWIRIEVGSG